MLSPKSFRLSLLIRIGLIGLSCLRASWLNQLEVWNTSAVSTLLSEKTMKISCIRWKVSKENLKADSATPFTTWNSKTTKSLELTISSRL
jgi:hypothetical protein